ncbi:MAG TPA: GNAT family N-acetyltransferase [Ornithinibacter sp.]|nr:GNAT family N-acetyltransferase [Ornithinibacter sp.]
MPDATNRQVPLTVRPAAPVDHARIVAVLDDWWGGRAMADMLPRLFLDHFASTSLVADAADGALAGFLVGFLSPDQPGTAYVHFVGVAPEYRRGGLAADLYERFFSLARAAGSVQVKAVTAPINEGSQRFHQSLGFTVSEPVVGYDGEGGDRVVMTYGLAGEPSPAGSAVALPELPLFAPRTDSRPEDAAWPEARWPPPADTVLRGSTVELRPTSIEDAKELFAALDDSRVWAHVRGRPSSAGGWRTMLEAAPTVGRFPWTLRLVRAVGDLPGGAIVGSSSFLEVAPADARLEIGWTVCAPAVWGTHVNPAAKLLLLGYAFDTLSMGRVQLKTDIRNVRSQQAIARLGARYEGVLRRYQRRADGTVRDTVLFSITAEEWPAVRNRLDARLTDAR